MLRRHTQKTFFIISAIILLWVILTSSPFLFKEGTIVSIEKGDSVKIVAQKLKENKIIRSEILFTNIVILFKLDNKIVAGDYVFKDESTMLQALRRISNGDYQIEVKRVLSGVVSKGLQ